MTWRWLWFWVGLGVAGLASADAGTWKQIDDDEGIKVWRLEIPGVEMPGFRGETVIDAPSEKIVGVLKQTEHHTEWMKNCVAADTLKKIDGDHTIVYNRTHVPWPIWDRDVVLETQFTYAGEVTTLSFHETDPKLRALPDRVVRMPRLTGSYVLTKLGEGKTRVRYTIEADVGGSIPTWLAKRVAKEMPYETLHRLRARVTGKK